MFDGKMIVTASFFIIIILIWNLIKCLGGKTSNRKLIIVTFLNTSFLVFIILLFMSFDRDSIHYGLRIRSRSFFSNEIGYKQVNGNQIIDREKLEQFITKYNNETGFRKIEAFMADDFALIITERNRVGLSIVYYDPVQNESHLYPENISSDLFYPFPE